MSISPTGPKMRAAGQAPPGIDEADLTARVAGVLGRWPSAGLAVGVVREGSLAWFLGHGVADVRSKAPITEDTVFRIGSLTKTFTATAVMQLWEQGLVDLDAPANDYLRSFQLVPAKASFRPATVRHLLTHTAGVGYWRRLSDLIRPGVGSGDRAGRSGAPPLADYYRKGLPVEVEPGTKWVYSNHGFAVLGQIVEGVSGQSLDRYLRDHIFEPLGMEHTDLIRSGRVRPRLATGYVLRPGGLEPVADREVPTPGGGGMYSTAGDMARAMVLAPDDGIGVFALSNTGGLSGRGAPAPLATALLRRVLGLPDQAIRTGIPARPETWSELCGWYSPDPGPVTNLFTRALFGAGAEVTVHGGHLMLKPLTLVPAMRRGMRLYPDDPGDSRVFRVEFPKFGYSFPVVFSGGSGDGVTATRLLIDLFSFHKRPDVRNPRRWVNGVAAAGAVVLAIRHRHRLHHGA